VKYDNELVLVAKEETLLICVTDRLNETGRCCGMEKNVEKTKVMRI
jgi:predicted fused transcriptional regulator/phosphomethylpyrimidine kinase